MKIFTHIPYTVGEIKRITPRAFLKLPPLTPLQEGLNLSERPPLKFYLCFCYITGVSWPGGDLRHSVAANRKCIKKINDTAKISLPLGQIIHQRAWLLLSILLDIEARTFNTGKEFRKLKWQKLQVFSSIFFYSFVLFIHLSYIFILYVYLFIYYFPPSASPVCFLILQTPRWGRWLYGSQPLWRWLIWKLRFLIKSATPN